MTPITYTWKVESVNTDNQTFVVEYISSSGAITRLNLQLPITVDKIPATVEAAAPRQILVPPVVLPSATPLQADAVLAMRGTATISDPVVTTPLTPELAHEQFKKDIATALFELGITSNNMYIAPVTPATTATTTSTGSEPTVIG